MHTIQRHLDKAVLHVHQRIIDAFQLSVANKYDNILLTTTYTNTLRKRLTMIIESKVV